MKYLTIKYELKGELSDMKALFEIMKQVEGNPDIPLHMRGTKLLSLTGITQQAYPEDCRLENTWWENLTIKGDSLTFTLCMLCGPYEPSLSAICSTFNLRIIRSV